MLIEIIIVNLCMKCYGIVFGIINFEREIANGNENYYYEVMSLEEQQYIYYAINARIM